MSTKKRLALILLFFALMPSLIIGTFSYAYISSRLTDLAGNTAFSLAVSNREYFEDILDEQKNTLSSLCASPLVGELLEVSGERTISRSDKEYQHLYSLLVKKANQNFICQKISIYDTNNKVVVSSDENCLGIIQAGLSDLTYKKDKSLVTSELAHSDSADYYHIDIIRPYYADSNLLGYIVSTIDTSYFDNMMQSAHLQDNCGIMLSDSEGTILYHTNSKFIGKTLSSSDFSQIKVLGKNGSSGYFSLVYDKTDYVLGYSVIDDLDWLIMTQQRTDTINSLSHSILIVTAVCLISTVGISIPFILYFCKKTEKLPDL